MKYSRYDLAKHLKEDHYFSPFGIYLKEIVYGANDGIITTFAVVASFTGAGGDLKFGSGYMIVLIFGLANLIADGASMSLGNFLSIRSEQDKYLREEKKERSEIETNLEIEKAESIELLCQRGFSREQSIKLVEIYSQNTPFWIDFMMKYELEMQNPFNEKPLRSALATFLAFVSFGSIPLLPYIILAKNDNHFMYAVISTVTALLLLGILRYKVTKESIVRSIGEIIGVGSIAAIFAYIIGTFFRL